MAVSTDSFSDIPVVDLQDLRSPYAEPQRRAEAAILSGFGTYGLIYIRNHELEPSAVDAFYGAFGDFTRRPMAEKETLSRPDIWYQRGWTPPNTERAVVAGGQPDFKECYFAAPEPLDPIASVEYPEVYAKNIWPEDGGALRESMLAVGHALHNIGLALLRGCARTLGLPPYRFEAATHGGPHVTRALRYLPLADNQVGTDIVWGEEHTDFNLLTLLPGGRFFTPEGERCARPDDDCGLYLRTRGTADNPHGGMIRGTAPDGCIVAQVGQQLEILTGGRLLATPHVIRPPAAPGYSRMAAAHFIHTHAHQLLFPDEPFRHDATIRAYSPPVLAGTYGTKTLVDIGLAPPESLGSLGYRHYDRLADARK
ncbi:MAG: isopenicillin N synthase-like dioxygenase [Myxococcota bacterium]|jgi:isopenicillin N synthase-like dioxygenase